MASSILHLILMFLFAALILPTTQALILNYNSSATTSSNSLHSLRSFCQTTPYPDICFNSLKLSISININPADTLRFFLQSLHIAISESGKLSALLFYNNNNIGLGATHVVEKLRGTIQDCQELHRITMSSLQRSLSLFQSSADPHDLSSKVVANAKAFLSAALTNKNTCLEGLDSASGPLKPVLVRTLATSYKYVSNTLSLLATKSSNLNPKGRINRRRHLMGIYKNNNNNNNIEEVFPMWMSGKDRRILQSSEDDEYEPGQVLVVAADGTGNFTTITDAINFAPNSSNERIFIYVTQGVYEENVEIPSYKPNIVLLGDGSDLTFITANRSVADAWTTFRSATLAVSGDGFLARDITIENRAGPEKHQAVALRVNADLVAFYRCTINGYQDTLYAHSFRQFYRECNISGTIDFIFGNAAVVFQACNIMPRIPLPGQHVVITAQSRDSPDEDTGISIQNSSIVATDDYLMYSNNFTSTTTSIKSYLGRPWKLYSRTVILGTYIDQFIDPTGWTPWPGDQGGLDTLYYGEYENYGPGSGTDNRVNWAGYHRMDYYEAFNFTVSELIEGDAWLDSTSFPYDDGI